MDDKVRLLDASRTLSPTAVVPITTNWSDFSSQWAALLNEVYAAAAAGAFEQDGQNIMVFLDDTPHVEVGIQVARTFTPVGRVVPSALPGGPAAMTVHQGPYDRLEEAHVEVRKWCATHGLGVTGVRWEIYGDWAEDPAQLQTQVWYQVTASETADSEPNTGRAHSDDRVLPRFPRRFAETMAGPQRREPHRLPATPDMIHLTAAGFSADQVAKYQPQQRESG